jgi:hydrogenase maturation protein HypF
MTVNRPPPAEHRIRIRVLGMVQGVGFRPFVANLADRLGLKGWVINDAGGATIEIQGAPSDLDAFVWRLPLEAPTPAEIHNLEIAAIATVAEAEAKTADSFRILDSLATRDAGTPVTPDIATCEHCLIELNAPGDRRYRYPFINCSQCGPRFTIQHDVPYDRPRTTMAVFTMCEACRREYEDPKDRRYHAQPNACDECGPRIWMTMAGSAAIDPPKTRDSERALREFGAMIHDGRIVAVKGIGGFHLACDATSGVAVGRLRDRKHRHDKPLAVMVRQLDEVEAFAHVDEHAGRVLSGGDGPIVLLKKRNATRWQAMLDAVAPNVPHVGVMLAYSPLHHLLIDAVRRPLVMTSGNLSEEPIARTNAEAADRLAAIADGFLLHDRPIEVACDDSVVRIDSDQHVVPLRRSRGKAPRPIRLHSSGPGVLAIGGDLKAAFCLTDRRYAIVSQHLGDVGRLETLEMVDRSVRHFMRLFRIRPAAVAADLHPGYVSRQWAERFAAEWGVPLIGVQHQVAHAAALIAESDQPPPQSIPVCCFDGTGYGTDGHVWGGECFVSDGTRFDRMAHLAEFLLPGGDACVRRPYRTALSLLDHCGIEWDEALPCVATCPSGERGVLRRQLRTGFGCTPTSSMGRLFDAIASLIGVRHRVSYEAQAAIEMEAFAGHGIEAAGRRDDRYRFDLAGGPPIRIGYQSLLQAIVDDTLGQVDRRLIAAAFHSAVARLIRDLGDVARESTGGNIVGLSGGVFQNAVLTHLAVRLLDEAGFQTLRHRQVPPNDGGLALGQAYLARLRLQRGVR